MPTRHPPLRSFAVLAVAALVHAPGARAAPLTLNTSPTAIQSQAQFFYDYNGGTIASGIPSFNNNSQTSPNSASYSYSWAGVDYSTDWTFTWNMATTATTTTITGTVHMLTVIDNTSSLPAATNTTAGLWFILDATGPFSIAANFSSPGDPFLGTTTYTTQASPVIPSSTVPYSGLGPDSGVGGAGLVIFGGGVHHTMTVPGNQSAAQHAIISFSMVATTIPAPGASAVLALAGTPLLIRRRRGTPTHRPGSSAKTRPINICR